MGLFQEFKAFIARGNALDLAVGVIIGAAFSKIVDSIVRDIITPAIGMLGGQPDFSGIAIGGTKIVRDGREVIQGGIMVGNFLNAVVSFLILAAVVFLCIVKPASKLMPKKASPNTPPPATLDDVVAAIKDLKGSLK